MFGLGMPELIVLSFVVIPVIFFFLTKGKKNVKSSKCTNCGSTLDNSAKFCNTCGGAAVVTNQESQTAMRPHSGSLFLKLILGAGFLLLLYAGVQYTGILNNAQSGGKDHLSNLDQEAVDIAKRFSFDKQIIKCGDYIYSPLLYKDNGQQFMRVQKMGNIRVVRHTLSEADTLNGVEWWGEVHYETNAPIQVSEWGRPYGEWSSVYGTLNKTVILEKKKGQWGEPGYGLGQVKTENQLTCQQVVR